MQERGGELYANDRKEKKGHSFAVVVFFVLFSALYLSMGMENGGYARAGVAAYCRVHGRSERFSVTEQVNVEELSGVRSLMLRLFPGMRRHAEEKESGTLTVTLEFLCVLYFLLRLRFIRMTGEQAEACISLKEAVIRYIHRQDGQKDKSGHKTEKNQLFYEKMTGGYTIWESNIFAGVLIVIVVVATAYAVWHELH